ncbi:MAG TPA: ribbon-helix-helix domain-containing protein [Candidatus Saccharimonadales bacterium]|nr:ribbon-helix-helix domain-containing protein [Candidatus Saccharimonadales bacterium]
MKVKTSITVDKDLLKAVDALSGKYKNRSEFIEAALQSYIAHLTRSEQNAKDLEIINRYADDLNREALDVLEYQVRW